MEPTGQQDQNNAIQGSKMGLFNQALKADQLLTKEDIFSQQLGFSPGGVKGEPTKEESFLGRNPF